LFIILCFSLAGFARADRMEPAPPELRDIGIDEKLGAQLPLDLHFADENGKEVALADYFHHDRPVVLQLSYFQCPMLCSLVSSGLSDSLNDLTLTMGKDFDVINLSFDPSETPALAALKKQSFLVAYNRPAGAEAWHFLTGSSKSIKQLTDSVGFKFKWIEQTRQFSHPAALILLSPDGKITRYLYGVKYDPKTLRLSLVEASQGKVGSTVDRFLLTCYHYDAYAGQYTPAAMNLMRGAGILTVIILASAITYLLRKEQRMKRLAVTH
jgi:protein SCO1/2